MFRAAILSVPLMLAACGDTAPPAENETIQTRGENQDALFELSDMNRDIAMRRAITGAGYPCDRVTGSGYAAPYENMEMWVATCDDDREWAVFIGADDTAQVRYCQDVEAIDLPRCDITRLGTGIYAPDSASVGEEG